MLNFNIFNRHMQALRQQSCVVEFRDLLVFLIANKVFHSDGLSFRFINDCFFYLDFNES